MTIKARELRAAGKPVITLTTGEPNFDSPPHAIEAAHQAALQGDTKYPPQDGTRALKEAIQRKFKRDSGLDYALDEIAVSNGGKQCLFNAIMATVDPGDEVIIPVPSWIAYAQMTQLCEGVPVLVNCPQNNGFKPRAEDIDAAITPRTKWLILNNPNNPTGACCSADEIAEIAAVMRKHPHVWILSDDMYEHLVFDGFQHATFAQVAPDLKDRTLTVSGVSKTYAMTGWRIGFAGGPKALIKAMTVMQGQATAGISTVGQAAAAAALDGPQDGVDVQIEAYKRRRDLAVEMLNAAEGHQLPQARGRVLRVPQRRRLPRQDHRRRPQAEHRRGCLPGVAGGALRRDGAWRRLSHEPVSADQHRHRGRRPAGRPEAHPDVLRRPAVGVTAGRTGRC